MAPPGRALLGAWLPGRGARRARLRRQLAPPEVERYTLRELAGDVAAVAAALDDEPVVLFGHDWGAPIAWHAAIRHPDRVRAVAGLSVPHTPPLPLSLLDVFDQLYADRFFYMLRFRSPA